MKIKYKTRQIVTKILSIVMICVLGLTAIMGVMALSNKLKEDTKVINPVFKVGAVGENGNYDMSNVSIYTADLIECQGLCIEPDYEALGTFRVFYYNTEKTFIGSTDEMDASNGVYNKDNTNNSDTFIQAAYCRIVITPSVPVDEDGIEEEDFKIYFWEVSKYANDYTISVYKKQSEIQPIFFGTNQFVKHSCSSVALGQGVNGYATVEGTGVYISDLVDISDAVKICIRINKKYLENVNIYFHKSDSLLTSCSLSKLSCEKVDAGDYVYLIRDLSGGFENALALSLESTSFDMTGTEIYVW